MKWRAAYTPGPDSESEVAHIEADSASSAEARLREVVGTRTDVLFVVPDGAPTRSDSYESFLKDPEACC